MPTEEISVLLTERLKRSLRSMVDDVLLVLEAGDLERDEVGDVDDCPLFVVSCEGSVGCDVTYMMVTKQLVPSRNLLRIFDEELSSMKKVVKS